MMATLKNRTRNCLLAEHVQTADRLLPRLKGLLGRESLSEKESLWLKPGNSIHTWFMKFPIDVLFVDKHLKVRSISENVHPWQVLWPVWGASSVFELKAGALKDKVQIGDELYVDD